MLAPFAAAGHGLYQAGTLPGCGHLYVGEEAVATGICAHRNEKDWITSTHRGHGHALAKGLEPRVLMAELARNFAVMEQRLQHRAFDVVALCARESATEPRPQNNSAGVFP